MKDLIKYWIYGTPIVLLGLMLFSDVPEVKDPAVGVGFLISVGVCYITYELAEIKRRIK